MEAAAGIGAGAIRRGPFCGVAVIGRKEFQKPLVFGGVLSPISFAAERNGAAGGKKEIILPLLAKVGRAGARNLPAAPGGVEYPYSSVYP